MSTTLAEKGVLHYEGGWPKDVNYQDPEQTLRYRRKIEKDEAYMTQIPKMGEVSWDIWDEMKKKTEKNRMNYLFNLSWWMVFLQKIEACILQNNAVNIFEEYFEGLEPAPIVEQSSARTMYVYKDVETPTVSFRIKSTEAFWALIFNQNWCAFIHCLTINRWTK